MADSQTVLYQSANGVAVLRLNRPDRRNALTTQMLSELTQMLNQAGDDASVRAVIITGAGKGFCAGQDLSAFDGRITGEQVHDTVMNYYKPMIMRICTLEKPVIGAINGVAAGAGASLALACDFRVMADDASLMQAFINIGLVPDAGSTWFLSRLIGYSRALETAIEGQRISAQRCLELGLANRVSPAATLLDDSLNWARQLAQRPTYAIGLTKKLMMESANHSLEEMIAREAETQILAITSDDHREGVIAFQQKRLPIFAGK